MYVIQPVSSPVGNRSLPSTQHVFRLKHVLFKHLQVPPQVDLIVFSRAAHFNWKDIRASYLMSNETAMVLQRD
jgi:hypothetical protein